MDATLLSLKAIADQTVSGVYVTVIDRAEHVSKDVFEKPNLTTLLISV